MWATLGAHAPTLAVVVVISGLVIRYCPQIAAIIFTGERRRAAFEVLRLRRKDAAEIPTYLAPDDPPVVKPPRRKALPKAKSPDSE